MDISTKLDQIRQKPEHVRVRYAWAFSIALTLVVVVIWIVSLAAQHDNTDQSDLSGGSALMDNLGQQGQSLESAGKDISNSVNQAQQFDPTQTLNPDANADDNSASDNSTDGTDATGDGTDSTGYIPSNIPATSPADNSIDNSADPTNGGVDPSDGSANISDPSSTSPNDGSDSNLLNNNTTDSGANSAISPNAAGN